MCEHTSNWFCGHMKPLYLAKRPTRPVWIRLPEKKGRCLYTGLSRTTLFELSVPCAANDLRPPVESVVIKKRYAQRGIRLIRLKSLMRHLRDLVGKEEIFNGKDSSSPSRARARENGART